MRRAGLGNDGASRLESISVLSGLSQAHRQMLARLADEMVAEPGETLVRQGDRGYEFLMIEEGTADVLQDGVRINTMTAGDVFGELAVLDAGTPRTATVVATSPLRGIVLTAHFMREMRARIPGVAEQIDQLASVRLERDRAERGVQG